MVRHFNFMALPIATEMDFKCENDMLNVYFMAFVYQNLINTSIREVDRT